MVTAKSLWGEIPVSKPLPDLPSRILREQGAILTEATSGVLIGEVKSGVSISAARTSDFGSKVLGAIMKETYGTDPDNQFFTASLRMKVPSLNGYVFDILSIEYPIDLYPLKIRDNVNQATKDCQNVAEYEQELEQVLSSTKVKSVITALFSQASDTALDEDEF